MQGEGKDSVTDASQQRNLTPGRIFHSSENLSDYLTRETRNETMMDATTP